MNNSTPLRTSMLSHLYDERLHVTSEAPCLLLLTAGDRGSSGLNSQILQGSCDASIAGSRVGDEISRHSAARTLPTGLCLAYSALNNV